MQLKAVWIGQEGIVFLVTVCLDVWSKAVNDDRRALYS